jgi:hypothetical protein
MAASHQTDALEIPSERRISNRSETPSVNGVSLSAVMLWRIVANLVNTWLTLLVQIVRTCTI